MAGRPPVHLRREADPGWDSIAQQNEGVAIDDLVNWTGECFGLARQSQNEPIEDLGKAHGNENCTRGTITSKVSGRVAGGENRRAQDRVSVTEHGGNLHVLFQARNGCRLDTY